MLRGHRGHDCMVVGFTKVVSLNPAHDKVYSIQQYVIKFVSDLRQVAGFLQFPPPKKKLTAIIYNITEILLEVALNTIILTLTLEYSPS